MALLSPPSCHQVSWSGRCWLGVLAVLLVSPLAAQSPNVEYRIKSAYILNFAKFVSWPSRSFASDDAPIVIGISGKDHFGSEIDHTIAGKAIEKRRLQLKRLTEMDPLEGCHIIFIAESERKRLPQMLENAARLSILTVGEMEDFTDLGGMIQFLHIGNTIRFEINLEAVEAARLKISSKLLQVAIIKEKARK